MPNKPEALTVRGLQRRCKRQCIGKSQLFFAITTPGFEGVLSSEIAQFDTATIKQVVSGGVEFSAPFEMLYDANVMIRSANRILMRIGSFTARSYPELYNKARRIPWEVFCGFSKTISFTLSSKHSRLHHTGNIERAVHNALTEHMAALGVAVKSEENAPLCFHVRFYDDLCTISIDTSGELLYKRGFRVNTAHAPIRETIAAAILLESQWGRYCCIADPMCGSGTFLLEAAMLVLNRAPGGHRSFAFQSWPSYGQAYFNRVLNKCKKKASNVSPVTLYGSDIDQTAVNAASENAQRLGVKELLTFTVDDCLNFNASGKLGNNGLVISNLPYGKRVGAADSTIKACITKFSAQLKNTCKGWGFALVSAQEPFEKLSGLHADKKIPFVNGGIPVTLYLGRV